MIYLLFCKIGFIGSYLAVTALTIANCIKYRNSIIAIICCLVIWLLVIVRHKDNVKRFIKGKENTLSIVGKNEVKENIISQDEAQDTLESSDSDDLQDTQNGETKDNQN